MKEENKTLNGNKKDSRGGHKAAPKLLGKKTNNLFDKCFQNDTIDL